MRAREDRADNSVSLMDDDLAHLVDHLLLENLELAFERLEVAADGSNGRLGQLSLEQLELLCTFKFLGRA